MIALSYGPGLRNEGAQDPCPDYGEFCNGEMQAAAVFGPLTVAWAPGCARLLHAVQACSAGMGERAPELLACNPRPRADIKWTSKSDAWRQPSE